MLGREGGCTKLLVHTLLLELHELPSSWIQMMALKVPASASFFPFPFPFVSSLTTLHTPPSPSLLAGLAAIFGHISLVLAAYLYLSLCWYNPILLSV